MKKTILIIDDKEEFRKLTKTILNKFYNVHSSENALNAFSLLQNGLMPDLIISDLMMPVMGGKEFLHQIKSSGVFKHIPVIILSSIDIHDEITEIKNIGAADYLTKPYKPTELLAKIDTILN